MKKLMVPMALALALSATGAAFAASSSDPNAYFVAFGLFDNVRVYALAAPASPPVITAISLSYLMSQPVILQRAGFTL